jgi:hypothetical protein
MPSWKPLMQLLLNWKTTLTSLMKKDLPASSSIPPHNTSAKAPDVEIISEKDEIENFDFKL